MELAPLQGRGGRQFIGAYGGGGFRVSGTRYTGSVLVFPERTVAWPVRGMAELDARSLDPVGAAAEALDLVLVGCGRRAEPLPESLVRWLAEAGLGVECMDTGAACRTFNLLMAEERRVAAALIAVD